ncbi:MAG: transcriptional regulator [Oscillospiraceae bacterium]|nr:transcriptional regulator [Oscillospiraceae bacterium]
MFDRYNILEKIAKSGIFRITADQIKVEREPRLMTKFDHRVSLPSIFKDNNLAILPVTRGDYVISRFSAYHDFERCTPESQRVNLPLDIQSLLPQYIVSEAIALNCANACGILEDFLEDENLVSTVSGRMSSGEFCFNIAAGGIQQAIDVRNSQIEIDAAYEGRSCLALFEAKRDISNDFLVRQLYYPFRAWCNRVTKKIKPVFLVFSNGVFYLYQYEFTDPQNYNSLSLVKQKNYILSPEITVADIQAIVGNTPICLETEVAFPQADSMKRIVNLMEMLSEGDMTKEDITNRYIFKERQTNYYTTAGRYLGFIKKGERCSDGLVYFSLSGAGRRVMKMPYRERQIAIATAILRHRVFNETLKIHLQYGEMPDNNMIVQIMKNCGVYNVVSPKTFNRRASTVRSWIEWVLGLIEGE